VTEPHARAHVQELARRIAALPAALGRRAAVGISGPDCAGKSTLAAGLAAMLEGSPVLVVSGDDFTRPTPERYAEPDEGLSYYRDSFDYRQVHDLLLPALRRGLVGELELLVSDRERDDWRTATFVLEPHTTLIVEGCFLFAPPGRDAFDLSVWIDLPLEDVVPRALERDLERMGGADTLRARYRARYLPGQRLHLARDTPARFADVVLRTGDTPL
jgi:uridine kinase